MFNKDASTDLTGIEDTLILQTIPMQDSRYKTRAYIDFVPLNNSWTYKILIVFLNQLAAWRIDPDNGIRRQAHRSGTPYIFAKFIFFVDPKCYIIIHFDNEIHVKGSKKYIDLWKDSQRTKENWISKEIEMVLCSSSRAILKNSSLLYYPEESFSISLKSFVASFVKMKVAERSEETSSIFELFDIFLDTPQYESVDYENIKKKKKHVKDICYSI